MSRAQNIWQRYRQLPRAGRWAVGAAVLIVLGLLWRDYVLAQTVRWNEAGDKLVADVAEATGVDVRIKGVDALQDSIRALGELERPQEESEAEAAITAAINDVLKRHIVSDDSFNYRGPGKLARGTLSNVLRPGQEAQRVTVDLRFDATPEAAIDIIAELEASPRIEAVSSVHLTKQTSGRKVKVDLTVESWIVSASRRPRRGGPGGGL